MQEHGGFRGLGFESLRFYLPTCGVFDTVMLMGWRFPGGGSSRETIGPSVAENVSGSDPCLRSHGSAGSRGSWKAANLPIVRS